MEYVMNFTWDNETCVWIAVPELLSLNTAPNLPISPAFLSERHKRVIL